jgi:serine/threonine-protein kinase
MPGVTEQLKIALADRYLIERELGAGGMATVYLAHDAKHNRKVALKVLRPELAALIGAERFLKEIEVTANLQHPHILPLHDSGEAGTFLYYVMPFVEGETLRDKMNREKQLGIEDAIEITRSVAGALDYAHRHDVIHRDIKPENILLHDGQAMVADFGIALAVSQAGGTRLTETGLSVGTPHYMSPEQAMGDRELDARSDIYSLGAMLYEMLAGDPPYTGSTAQAIVAKVITEKAPPVTTYRDTVPPHTAAAIQKALAKLPADRFSSASSFAEALVTPGVMASLAATAADTAAARPGGKDWRLMGTGLVAVLAIAAALWGWLEPTPPADVARFQVGLPAAAQMGAAQNGQTIALSPDGKTIVYVGPDRQLFVREIDEFEARPLPGTQNSHTPFFSPDGEWVGFYSGPNLKRIALAGGTPLTVASANILRGADWGPDGFIVFTPTTSSGLHRVAAGGGAVDTLTVPDSDAGEIGHRWAHVLPNGKGVVFVIWKGSNETAQLAALSFETGEIRPLIAGTGAKYVKSGHLVYGSADASLLAVPFDQDRLEVTGSPVSLLDGVLVKSTGAAEFGLSEGGTLTYLSGEPSSLSLVITDRDGRSTILADSLTGAFSPRFSPDGKRVVLRIGEQADDIWIYELGQGTISRLTFEGDNGYPVWTPDGRSITFHSSRSEGSRDIYRRAADGSGSAEVFIERDNPVWEIAWAPDGRGGVFREISSEGGLDIYSFTLDSPGEHQPYVVTPFNERAPVISPDGRWLAYVSNESGQDEVYVRAYPDPSGRWQVSSDGGMEPLWAPSGRELYYRTGDRLMAVDVTTRGTFSLGNRRPLFEGNYLMNQNHTNYDVHPASGEFVTIKSQGSPTELIVVLNWFEELRERAGS